jgi:DNA-binding transcriptional ArsR family regulator
MAKRDTLKIVGQPRTYFHPSTADVRLQDVLFALSDPTRLAIASELADGSERTSGELLNGSVPKSTMSHHLKILREAGITRSRVDGMRCFVSLRQKDLELRFPKMFKMLMGFAGPVARVPPVEADAAKRSSGRRSRSR